MCHETLSGDSVYHTDLSTGPHNTYKHRVTSSQLTSSQHNHVQLCHTYDNHNKHRPQQGSSTFP